MPHTIRSRTNSGPILFAITLAAGVIFTTDITAEEARTGEDVFQRACYACHGTGLNGAPVKGDQTAWEERLQKGESTLYENTLNGLNNMPPRGACANCSDIEIAAAVRYLLNM
jgi:cytochrome c5